MRESQESYKRHYDKSSNTIINTFVPGDKVLVKRTSGSHVKLNPKWLDGPYTIEKKIGPVNYAVSNSKGVSKILHHNLLKPALELHEPTKTPDFNHLRDMDSSQPVSNNGINLNIPLRTDNRNPVTLQNTLDIERFSENVLGDMGVRNNSNNTTVRTSSGRVSRPVERYEAG